MLRSAKRHPEFTVSELTDHDGPWLENQLAGVSTQRHQSNETRADRADLAEKVLSQLPPDDRLVLLSIDGEQLQVRTWRK